MKILPGNVRRIVVKRVIVAWAALSIVAGALAFYVELERINRSVFLLTFNESKRFTGHIDEVGPQHVGELEAQAKEFLKGDFISVRLYGADKTMTLEVLDPNGKDPRRRLPAHIHDLAPGEFDHHHMYWLNGQLLMQVLVPVAGKDGVMHGYFEGVYAVNADTLGDIKTEMTAALALTLGIVLATAAVLYSVIGALTRSLVSLSSDLLKSNIELMEVLGSAIALRDSVTDVHNYRVTAYAIEMANTLRLPARQVRDLIAGAFLHDAGKIGVGDAILLKPGPLTPAEKDSMRHHVSFGAGIVANSGWLQGARDVVEFHHERFDGSGYLRGLSGAGIPLTARIFAIIDVFDALVSTRPYKAPLPFGEAVALLERSRGTHFDPVLLDVFLDIAAGIHARVSRWDVDTLRRHVRTQVAEYFLLADETAHG